MTTPRALMLGGPTSAGKSDAAVDAAERWGAVILSADAMQVYRGMDVGTGKVGPRTRARVPHFGLDVVDPDGAFDASDFVALADEVLAAHPRVVVVGGSSLYLRALVRGLVSVPPVDAALRASLERLPDLHARLAEVDPELALRLHPHDRIRLVRGLEVHHLTGQRLSELQADHAGRPDRVQVDGLWLDRDDLDPRIDARVLQMVADGLVVEVRGLLDSGFGRDLKPMRSLGYRHLCDHVLDDLVLDEAVRRTQRDTRRFARKQRTWRKHLPLAPVASAEVARAADAAAARLWA